MRKKKVRRRRTASEKQKCVQNRAKKMAKKMTWPEAEFVKLMKEMGINCESQKVVRLKIYDFFLPDYNILIEVDGDYWHGNSKLFENLNKTQLRNKKNDKYKDTLANALGYQLMRVWESDLKNSYTGVKNRFKEICR